MIFQKPNIENTATGKNEMRYTQLTIIQQLKIKAIYTNNEKLKH